jgi:hypothetical protein
MRINLKSKKVVATALAVTVMTGGGAYAYWTAGGSGEGEVTTRAALEELEVSQTTVISNLAPGVGAQQLSGTIENLNTSPVFVSTVTAAIASVLDADGDAIDSCDAGDYALTDAVMTLNSEVLAGDSSAWTGAKIAFYNDPQANQDACKGAVVSLSYTIG